MGTYTYTQYFSDDSEGMPELKIAYHKLTTDFEDRREHMDPQAARAIERRLEVLRSAWALLLEPVPRPYGG